MCRQVKCRKCSKPSWAGCGAHVEQVLAHVPRADRCTCRETARAAGATDKPGFFARLFGRG
jgi:hypothetical protein